MPRILGIYVKQPVPGRVKTRLAEDVGAGAAVAIYQAFLRDVITRFQDVADERFLCFTPETSESRNWFQSVGKDSFEYWPQPAGSLSERLAGFFDFAGLPDNPVVVIGSDSPSLPLDYVDQAFQHLNKRDAVLGPATDGGFYLLGLRRPRPVFEGIDWSTSRVLGQIAAKIAAENATLAVLPPWYDVDTADDLELLRGHLLALATSGNPLAKSLERTQAALTAERNGSASA